MGGPVAGPAICRNIAYVPLYGGRVRAFAFGDGAVPWPMTYRSRASVFFSATTAGDSVVWANNVGDISVITAGRHGVNYRLRLTDAIVGSIIYNPPAQILGVTATGYVYCFDVTNGQLLWRYASGEPSDEPAAIVGDTVFLLTRRQRNAHDLRHHRKAKMAVPLSVGPPVRSRHRQTSLLHDDDGIPRGARR